MKNTTILIIIAVIIISAGAFVFVNGNAKENLDGGTGDNINEITLSMRNYNYYPNTITVKKGDTVRIHLDKSITGCYRSFTIRDFGIAKNLRTPEDYVEFVPDRKGTFTFACSMGMGRGRLIVN